MKFFAILAASLAMAFSCSGAPVTLEDISPHLSTNAAIVWQAPMDSLPKTFWIYKKTTQIFSATTISNAIILAAFQNKGFPKPSTHRITIWGEDTLLGTGPDEAIGRRLNRSVHAIKRRRLFKGKG